MNTIKKIWADILCFIRNEDVNKLNFKGDKRVRDNEFVNAL